MQTQGILLNVSAVQSRTTNTASKSKESNFDSFMADNVAGSTGRREAPVTKKATADQTDGKKDVKASSEEYNKHKLVLNKDAQKPKDLEQVDVEVIETQVVTLLKETFGLSEEDIVDILEQLGLTPMDLALMMSQDSVQITPVHMENIKTLVMEVHGIADDNIFLMSDKMCQELQDIMTGIQDILSQELGVDWNQLSQDDTVLLQSFAEKWETLTAPSQKEVEEPVISEDHSVLTETAGKENQTPVVVEMSSESDTGDTGEKMLQTMTEPAAQQPDTQTESPIQAFAERLSQSFESVAPEETAASRVTMDSIVEQVVRHVRIRVLPQTTSMELQLNPESLGRVNLTVTSQNGMATATLTVQNEVAKEALESQITVLKENLENHGLKVESVEVTVSEFGFKNPEDSNSDGYQRKKNGGKRFRFDAAGSVEDEATVETEEDRQDGDSVVDYTA